MTAPKFSNNNPVIQQDFTQAVTNFSPQLKINEKKRSKRSSMLHVEMSGEEDNPLIQWLQNIELWCKKSSMKVKE